MSDAFQLAQAYVQIIPSTENIGGQVASSLVPGAGEAGDQAGEAAGNGLAGKLKAVIAGAGIAMAVKGAIDSVAAAINEVASAGDEIDKTSQKMGVSAREYQAMAFAAEHCGFSTSTFNTAVKKLQSSGYEGTIADYMDGLMAIEDPAERAAKAQEDLGSKVANEMAAFINGGDSLSDYATQLENLGGMMSNEAVAASASYEDALTDMHRAMDGAKAGMVTTFLPACTDVMNGIAKLVSGDEGGFASIKSGVQSFVEGIGAYAEGLKEKAAEMIQMLVTGIAENLPELLTSAYETISEYATGIMQNLPTMIQKAGEIITTLVQGLMSKMPTIMQKGFEMVSSIAKGIINNLPAIVSSIAQVVAKLLATIAQNLPSILQKGVEILGKLMAGIIQAIPQIPGYIMQVISSIREKFTSYDWGSIGKSIIDGIKNGLTNAAGAIAEAAKSAAKKALDAAKNLLGIHSPSRVFRDVVGKNIALGWAEGIDSNADTVEASMNDLVDDSIRTVNSNALLSAPAVASDSDRVISLLQIIAEKELHVSIGKREFHRSLEDEGVVFA